MPTGSAGNISPSSVTDGFAATSLGAATGPCSASSRAYFSIAPARTSFASAWVGTPKPGTSMPTIRTPLIESGSNRSGTPLAVGTHRLVTMIVSYFSGSAISSTASLISSNSLPVTSVSELNGT